MSNERLKPHQHGVLNPYGHRVAALGFMEALMMRAKTYQFWLCPSCNNLTYNDYDPDQDDGSMGYQCDHCDWVGSNNMLMLGLKM